MPRHGCYDSALLPLMPRYGAPITRGDDVVTRVTMLRVDVDDACARYACVMRNFMRRPYYYASRCARAARSCRARFAPRRVTRHVAARALARAFTFHAAMLLLSVLRHNMLFMLPYAAAAAREAFDYADEILLCFIILMMMITPFRRHDFRCRCHFAFSLRLPSAERRRRASLMFRCCFTIFISTCFAACRPL